MGNEIPKQHNVCDWSLKKLVNILLQINEVKKYGRNTIEKVCLIKLILFANADEQTKLKQHQKFIISWNCKFN